MKIDAYTQLLPAVGAANEPYWEGCRIGELRLQVCSQCDHHRFPDSPVCPRCLADEFEWRPVSGRGRVWSWIVMHQRYFEAFEDELPYVVLLVELDEGPWMISGLAGDSTQLQVDQRVEVVFERIGDRSIPKFRIVE